MAIVTPEIKPIENIFITVLSGRLSKKSFVGFNMAGNEFAA